MEETRDNAMASWPPMIESLPDADLNMDGLQGHILKSGECWVLFLAADQDVAVPMHRHGAQWGVVLAGHMDLTIDGLRHTFQRGDTHYIPQNVDHEALLYKGWQGLYVFRRPSSRPADDD